MTTEPAPTELAATRSSPIRTRTKVIRVERCNIAYSFFESQSNSPHTVFFLHGYRENRSWWDHVAPLCAAFSSVLSIDLSGNGDSGHRRKYSIEQHAREVLACARDRSISANIWIVANGVAFTTAIAIARLAPEKVRAIILVDPTIAYNQMREKRIPFVFRLFSRAHGFKSIEDGTAAFKRRITSFGVDATLLDSIARHSLITRRRNSYWKEDVYYASKLRKFSVHSVGLSVASVETPAAVIYGQLSGHFGKVQLREVRDALPEALLVGVDGAGHHVFLDKPRQAIEALALLIAKIEGPSPSQ